jgi:hypothetical protein
MELYVCSTYTPFPFVPSPKSHSYETMSSPSGSELLEASNDIDALTYSVYGPPASGVGGSFEGDELVFIIRIAVSSLDHSPWLSFTLKYMACVPTDKSDLVNVEFSLNCSSWIWFDNCSSRLLIFLTTP